MPTAKPIDVTTPAARAVVVRPLDAAGGPPPLAVSSLSPPANGRVVLAADQSVVYVPNDGFTGADGFAYTVRDGAGGEASAVVAVTVLSTGRVPVARDDLAATRADLAVTLRPLANDADPVGAGLALAALGRPNAGRAALGADGALTYTPDAGFSGEDSFTYAAADAAGGVAAATVRVVVSSANRPPSAAGDAAGVVTGDAVTIDVLANDADPDGDRLEITGVGRPAHGRLTLNADRTLTYRPDAGFAGSDGFTYAVTDGRTVASGVVRIDVSGGRPTPAARDDAAATVEGVPVVVPVLANDADPAGAGLRVTEVGRPARGRVTVNADRTLTYAPDAGFTGPDSFAYTASDGTAFTTATVRVAVAPADRPPNAGDDAAVVPKNGTVTIDVLANDADPEGAALTLAAVGRPSHGTATIAAGRIVYAPARDYVGSDGFAYTARDAGGKTATGVVAIDVTDPGPALAAVDDLVKTTAGVAVDLAVLANDTGRDLAIARFTGPAHGTVRRGAGGVLTYTPAAGFTGSDGFAYTATDGRAEATARVTVEVGALGEVFADGRPFSDATGWVA